MTTTTTTNTKTITLHDQRPVAPASARRNSYGHAHNVMAALRRSFPNADLAREIVAEKVITGQTTTL